MDKGAQKLLVIGWDAADWQVIDSLLADGKMPYLASLINSGVRGPLRTLEPKLSPLLWTSVATGKTADKHGVLNFVEPKPDGEGLRVVQSTTRKSKALWNILSQSGLRSLVIGWYATHPAEPIDGVVITNLIHEHYPKSINETWPLLSDSVHPQELAETVSNARQHHLCFDEQFKRNLLPKLPEIGSSDERVETLLKLLAYVTSIENSACLAMRSNDWDAAFVFYDAIDTIGHHFMEYRKPKMAHVSDRDVRWFSEVMDKVYEWHDQSLGRILAKAGGNCTVIILSDHGFHSGIMRPVLDDLPPERRMEKESSWHRPYGIFVASGPGVRSGATLAPATLLDIAPTILAIMGLPVGSDMDGRVLSEIIVLDKEPIRIPSWEDEVGSSGQHPPEMREDPVDTAASIQQLIDLGYLAGIPADIQEQIALVRRESMFNLGISMFSRNKFEASIPIFKALLEERPDSVRYAICLARSFSGCLLFDKAIEVVEDVLLRDPANVECKLMLAQWFAQLGRTTESIRVSTELEKLSVNKPELAFNLAVVYWSQMRYEDAWILANKSCRLNPSDPMVHVLAGKAALQLGRFEEAAGKALDALEITQAFPEAHALLGMALSWYGDLESALQSFENAKVYHECPLVVILFMSFLFQLKGQNQIASDYLFDYTRRSEAEGSATDELKGPFGPLAFAAKHGLIMQ